MENSQQVINIDELIDDLIAACQNIYRQDEIGEAKKALTDVIGMIQDEIRWYREEKRTLDAFLYNNRIGAPMSQMLVVPDGDIRHIYEVKHIGSPEAPFLNKDERLPYVRMESDNGH